ncbi:hypothetical protein JTE90_007344 [Oedothorax gibbosus]|uniref:Uncharacterized protein n=1 Tax=Oedothorax gibbosus TaxID=931172 RepID=A0AAV6TXX7_9ARAC|nr:hypothetical protein JTE90_007344 [Oedothorax gibbosus]
MKALWVPLIFLITYNINVKCDDINSWLGPFLENLHKDIANMKKDIQRNVQETLDETHKSVAKATWYNGPNVCLDEETTPKHSSSEEANDTTVFIHYENCYEDGPFKLICESRITRNGSAEKRVKTYQCCEGYSGTYDKDNVRICVPKK